MSVTVYIKPDKNTEVHESQVFLSQVADVWCRDKALENKCKAMKIMQIHGEKEDRYVVSALDVVKKIQALDPQAEVSNLGEQDFVIDYQPKVRQIGTVDWLKTFFVCLIVFFGGAFAIMTFNNDGSVPEIFRDVDRLVTGMGRDSSEYEEGQDPPKTTGILIMEISYSVGLFLGVTLFFNHFGKKKVTIDPTPIEVQMRLYEDEVDTTVIRNASRKETDVDTQ